MLTELKFSEISVTVLPTDVRLYSYGNDNKTGLDDWREFVLGVEFTGITKSPTRG